MMIEWGKTVQLIFKQDCVEYYDDILLVTGLYGWEKITFSLVFLVDICAKVVVFNATMLEASVALHIWKRFMGGYQQM